MQSSSTNNDKKIYNLKNSTHVVCNSCIKLPNNYHKMTVISVYHITETGGLK